MLAKRAGLRSSLPGSEIPSVADTTNIEELKGSAERNSRGKAVQTTQQTRVTPRNSIAGEILADAANETPYETLRQLASIPPRPTTPIRRASSVGPPSTHKSNRRTPGALRTPRNASRPGSTRRPAAATPYGQAAIRGLEERRIAALTPGRNRSHDVRQQKDTPQDVLRLLSRILAPGTKVIESSSPQLPEIGEGRVATKGFDEDLDDELELRRPRLSIPLEEDVDDESLLVPPQRTPIPDEENLTLRDLEEGRRAISEQPRRFSRGSFGSVRSNEGFNIGLDDNDIDGNDSSFLRPGNFEDDDEPILEDPTIPRDFTGNLRRDFLNQPFDRFSIGSARMSESRPSASQDETERSFAFTVPVRDSFSLRSSLQRQTDLEIEESASENNDDPHDSDDAMEEDIEQLDPESVSIIDQTLEIEPGLPQKQKKKKSVKVSKYGIQYPSLPVGVVKKLASTYMRTSGNSKANLSKETLDAIMQASDWFFEQVSDDLATFSKHAGRKTIDESDVVTLMRRQRQTNASITPFALAQRYLPRELLQDLRMAPPPPTKLKKIRRLGRIQEE